MKKAIVVLLLMAFVFSSLSGCGLIKKFVPMSGGDEPGGEEPGGDEPGGDEPGGEEPSGGDPGGEEPEGDYLAVEGVIYYPENWQDILTTLAEFGYTHKEIREDGEESVFSMHYVSQGTEEINGVEAEVIHLTKVEGGVDEFRFWFDEDWNCLKAEQNGVEDSSWGAGALSILLQIYVNKVLLTQMVMATDGTIDTSSYKLEGQTSESSEIGQLEVYSFASQWTKVFSHYGFHRDGDLYFALIRSTLKDSKAMEELRVTHFNPR